MLSIGSPRNRQSALSMSKFLWAGKIFSKIFPIPLAIAPVCDLEAVFFLRTFKSEILSTNLCSHSNLVSSAVCGNCLVPSNNIAFVRGNSFLQSGQVAFRCDFLRSCMNPVIFDAIYHD